MEKVYIVVNSYTQHFENDLCWDEGYYDDYYETEVVSTEIVAVYSNFDKAQKEADRLNEQASYDENYYVAEYEVL